MDFALEETPQAVKDLAADVLRREAGRADVADPAASETGFDHAVWKALGEAGLLTLAVPERLGGSGLGPLEAALVLTETGRHAVYTPALSTVAFGVLPVSRLGTDEQQESLLAELDAGRVLTAALSEPSDPMPTRPRTGATAAGDDLIVSGRKSSVPYASDAFRILTPVSLAEGTGVVAIDPSADGVSLIATHTSTGMPVWTVDLDNVRVPRTELLGGRADSAVVEDVYRYAVAGICAVADGCVAGALDLTAQHLRTREQFGKPLATFQAVAQQIADAYITARTMNLAALSASWRLGEGRDADDDLSVAALWLTEELPPVLQTCHHLHGGLGVDVTYPMHRYYALVKDLTVSLGGAEHRLDQLADRCVPATAGQER